MTSERIGTARAYISGTSIVLVTFGQVKVGQRYDLYVETDGTLRYIPVR